MDALDNQDSLGAKWTRWALFGSTNISSGRSNKSLLKIFSSLQFVFADIIGTCRCPTFNVQVASEERWSRGRHCQVRWCLGCWASRQGRSDRRLWACDEVQSQTQVRRDLELKETDPIQYPVLSLPSWSALSRSVRRSNLFCNTRWLSETRLIFKFFHFYFQVAFQNGLDCGGGYVKLLSSAKVTMTMFLFFLVHVNFFPRTSTCGSWPTRRRTRSCSGRTSAAASQSSTWSSGIKKKKKIKKRPKLITNLIFRHVHPDTGAIEEKHCKKIEGKGRGVLEEIFKDKKVGKSWNLYNARTSHFRPFKKKVGNM